VSQHKKSAVHPVRAFQKEAEVETFYANIFDSIFSEVEQHYLGIDILTRNLLIEVKFNRNIEKEWADILAQALYYQNILVTLGERTRPYIAVVDEDEVCIFEAEELRHIWANDALFSKVKIEVQRASDAHQSASLMEAIHAKDITCWYFRNVAEGMKKLQEIEQFDQPQQRPIQVNNVIEAFDDWEEIVRDYLKNNGIENAFIFYEDATGKGIVSSTREWKGVVLTIIFETYGARISQIPEGQYRKFEKQWKRLDPNSKTAEAIRRRLYDLCEMDKRRSTGSFYTPHKLGKLAWERIVQHLGDKFWLDGTWRIWDNCAGIGNLQYEIIPDRDLTPVEICDCMLFALLHDSNTTAYTTVKTETDMFVLQNWFNPFDEMKFDWSDLSEIGTQAFAELTHYCESIVKWRTLQTPYGNNKGNGVWLGLYQYRTSYDTVNKTYKKKFGKDYPNRDLYGIAYPDRFKSAIEALRQRVEALAIDLCLTAGKEITRTRDTFLEQSQRQPNLSENVTD